VLAGSELEPDVLASHVVDGSVVVDGLVDGAVQVVELVEQVLDPEVVSSVSGAVVEVVGSHVAG
jgi:hypothetical protein